MDVCALGVHECGFLLDFVQPRSVFFRRVFFWLSLNFLFPIFCQEVDFSWDLSILPNSSCPSCSAPAGVAWNKEGGLFGPGYLRSMEDVSW